METNNDITEHKRAEEEVSLLSFALDKVREAAFLIDDGGRFQYVNEEACRVLGYSRVELLGLGVTDIDPEFPAERWSDHWRELKAQRALSFESRHRTRDGRVFPVEVSANYFEYGGRAYSLALVRGITERKKAEEALRRSEAYLAEAQRLSHTGSWALDVGADKYAYCSEECLRIYGFDPQGGLPTREAVFRRIHPEDWDRVTKRFEMSLREKVDSSDDLRIVLPDGTVKDIHVNRHPVLNDAGDVVGLVGTSMDITERKRAEEALRRSEGYLAEAQRLAHTGSWAWSPATRESLYWSEEMFRIFGLNPQEGVPTTETFWQRIHPEDLDRTYELLLKASRGNMEYEHEHRIVLGDGTVKHLHAIGHPVLDENGQVAEYVGTAVDVTERKRAEEALHESETRFRTFVDHAADAFFVLDSEQGNIIDVNRTACESLGYTRQELIGMTPLAFDANLDRASLESVAERTTAGEGAFIDRHWHRRKDGSLFPVEVHSSVFWHGGRRFLLKVARDISDRLRAEEAVRQGEEQLREVVEGIPAMAFINRPDGNNVFVNKRWTEYSGMSAEATAGSGWQTAIHPEEVERTRRMWRASTGSGRPFEHEVRLRSANGEYRWFLVRAVPLHDAQGKILKWYGILTDIEERKGAEEKLRNENIVLREEINRAGMSEEIVGASPALQAALTAVSKVAGTDSTVLITGETGTGKEMIARAIHKKSSRSSRPFVSVNCAAIPQSLIASELFGHEKGAFTGATQRRLGRFEFAEGGTIFLDEIGDLPAETQVALLRVLQEHEFERVGGTRSLRADVRVIAATNRDLEAAITAGTFRSDLYYRLNVFPIEVPPLRKRKEDIPLLVQYFVARYARKGGKNIRRVDKRSLELLQSYPWPGNVRELQNVIERSIILCDTETFSVDESWLSRQGPATEGTSDRRFAETLVAQEKEMIEAALRACGGRVFGPKGAAARLGMPRTTLESKIRSLKIDKHRFKAPPASSSH